MIIKIIAADTRLYFLSIDCGVNDDYDERHLIITGFQRDALPDGASRAPPLIYGMIGRSHAAGFACCKWL